MYRIEDVVPEGMDHTINEHAIAALQVFKDLKTSKAENSHLRLPAMQDLIDKLTTIYSLPVKIDLVNSDDAPIHSGDAECPVYTIKLTGSLSIISLLNAFFRIVQIVMHEPVEFLPRQRAAVLLFKKVYPEQFARLEFHPDTGGFSKPGRGLGFKARVHRPENPEPAFREEVNTVAEAVRILGVGRPTPMPEELVTQSISEEVVRTPEDLGEEVIDERDDHYYDEESPER